MTQIRFDQPTTLALAKAYHANRSNPDFLFPYKGQTLQFVTSYAYYLLCYLHSINPYFDEPLKPLEPTQTQRNPSLN